MKLTEAIEILKEWLDHDAVVDADAFVQAQRLLIEAGKWRVLMEHDYGSWCGPSLPGETKE